MLTKTAKFLAPVAVLAVFIAGALLMPTGQREESVAVAGGGGATAGTADADLCAAIEPLKGDHMAKLICHETAFNPMGASFTDADDQPMSVADLSGKIVLMNFWATWCPPCRAEMPSIDRLAGAVAGDDIAVMAVSTDRGGRDKIDRFFEEIEVEYLAIYRDKKSELARDAGAMGLPITIILDRQGREIARLIGEAEWDSPEAKEILTALAGLTS
ncbi:MAG: TlpA disulfide reductase family protein [Pseudomonadota bacterium]